MISIIIFSIKILIILFLSLTAFYFALLIPFAKDRNYEVLERNSKILLKGKQSSIDEISGLYKPIVIQTLSLRGPEPSKAFYEVTPYQEPYLYVIYRFVWPDEIHPNLFLHWFYKIMRIFYYGSFQDMEIIQIKVNMVTAEIEEIKYETDSSNNPDVFKSDHANAKLAKIPHKKNIYQVYLNKEYIDDIEIIFQENQPLIPVLTWNHVFAIKKRDEKYKQYDLPITPLSNEEFKKYRFDRRSWLDFGVIVNKGLPLQIGIILFTIIAIITSLVLFIL
jgi:hypothetical protein